jgi:deoxyribonuclease-4
MSERDSASATPAAPSARPIGFHVSIEGGLTRAVDRARERGCTAMQIFCGNPRAWRWACRSEHDVQAFRTRRTRAGLVPLVVHSCYLVNVCSPDRAVRRRSLSRLAAEFATARAIGAEHYVLHPGTARGRRPSWAVETAARTIVRAAGRSRAGGRVSGPSLLLETTATRHGPGGRMETLGQLLDRVRQTAAFPHVGLAVDTCHVFATGYDVRRRDEVDRLAADLVAAGGEHAVGLIHVNDARDPCGSGRDRHEHIGRGTIGTDGLKLVLNHPSLSAAPLILETPWESVAADRRNLRAVLRLLPGSHGRHAWPTGSA